MKLLVLVSTLMMSSLFAQVIDPTGSDDWKTLEVTLKTPHQKTYPTHGQCGSSVYVGFGGEHKYINLKNVTKDQPGKLNIQIPAAHKGRYYVSYKIRTRDMTLAQGNVENGVKKVALQFNRIDVNHMLVTREDRTTYYAKGLVQISYMDEDERWISICSSMPTKTGIDVPPGYKYRIRVDARTEDGRDHYEAFLDYR